MRTLLVTNKEAEGMVMFTVIRRTMAVLIVCVAALAAVMFLEEGQIASVGVVDGLERFDGNTAPHAHLVCSHCGAVVDVFQDFFSQLELDALSQQLCCAVQGARVTFEGLCPQCLAQQDAGKISEKPIQH